MRIYHRIWRATCIGFGLLGFAVGCSLLPIEIVIPIILLSIAAGLSVAIERESRRQGFPLRGSGRWIRIVAVACGTWAAVIGLGQILGVGFFLLVLVLAASSPRALRAYVRKWRGTSDAPYDCSTTSTAQLCREWQASYALLQRAGTTTVRMCIITARQRYLDELERRDPEGFNAWLTSAASPAGSPRRFIGTQRFEG